MSLRLALIALLMITTATPAFAQNDIVDEELTETENPGPADSSTELTDPPAEENPDAAPTAEVPAETDSVEEMVREEVAPPPEAPQPGAPESDEPSFAAPNPQLGPGSSSTNTLVDVPTPIEQRPAESNEKYIPRPEKVDKDSGDYYYGAEANYNDSKYYPTDVIAEPFSKTPGVLAPSRIAASGEYFYTVSRVKPKRSASLRSSFTSPPKITNPKNGATYEDLYGKDPVPGVIIDYEWFLANGKLGRIGIKFGSGIWTATGVGRFADTTRLTESVEERFTFVTFPNTLTLIYLFQMSSTQWIVPFVEGGGGYYTFAELRDDNKPPKIGGTPTMVGAGGLRLFLDNVDPRAIRSLENEYGIRHAWLLLEGRATVSVNKTFDFTAFGINAGVAFDF